MKNFSPLPFFVVSIVLGICAVSLASNKAQQDSFLIGSVFNLGAGGCVVLVQSVGKEK